jgi:hypothetical protein
MPDHLAGWVAGYRIDHVDKTVDFHNQPGFFANLPNQRVMQGFPPFQPAAGNAPLSAARFLAAPDEDDLAILVQDNRSHADNR